MAETIEARYIDPMVDWSFKRLFGTEVNKDILIEFLKVIFPEFDIEDITYLPTEQLGIMEKTAGLYSMSFAEHRTERNSWSKSNAARRSTSSRGHCFTHPSRF